MTFGELKTQFNAILNRTDITTALTELFINQSMQRAQRELRIPPQEVYAETVAASFVSLPVPSDLIEIIEIDVDGIPVTPMVRSKFLRLGEASAGQPMYWTRKGSVINLNPLPPDAAVITLHYYGQFTPLTSDAVETSMTSSSPDLIIYGALSYASDYYIDERAANFEQRYQQIMQSVQDQGYSTDGASAVTPTAYFDEDY